jgi:hypothetical protein
MAAMSPTRKRLSIAIVLVVGVLIGERAVSLVSADDEIARPVVHQRAPRAPGGPASAGQAGSAQAARLRLDRLDARELALADRDAEAPEPEAKAALFDSVSWQPPEPPAPPPPPPPKPVAPPFPYPYIGGLLDGGVRTAFFTKGERVLAVKNGDIVDGVYRVEQLTDNQMQMTYLPLTQSVVLALGGGR